jgi:hypothetical protein
MTENTQSSNLQALITNEFHQQGLPEHDILASQMGRSFRPIFTWRDRNPRTTTIILKTSSPLATGQIPTTSED